MTAKGPDVPHHPIGSDQLTTTGAADPSAFDAEPLYAAARAHRALERARCRARSGVALGLVGMLGAAVVVLLALV